MLTLYGNEFSVRSNKVRFVANALGLAYEYRRIDLRRGEGRTESYLKLHPAGKVPVLQDDDFVLFESNAIIKYLAAKASSDLYPQELSRRLLVDQWIDFVSFHVAAAVDKVFVNQVAYEIFHLEKDERSLKEGLAWLQRFLPIVEAQLQKHPFLAGPELSLADFVLLAALDLAEVSSFSLEPYPKLKTCYEQLQAEDFYQKCYPSYTQMLQQLIAKMQG